MAADETILNRVYNPKDQAELMSAYGAWASDYDRDTRDEFGYVGYRICADLMQKHLQGGIEERILDAGCGTGLVAEILSAQGYVNMDGLDYSREMLDEAGKKDVYKQLIQADLTRPMDIADSSYDALVCAGTLTYGHVGPDVFDEFLRVVKPGGIVCFTIREGAYDEYGYRKAMLDLEKGGLWELQEMWDEEYYKDKVRAKMCVYRINTGK